MSVKVNMGQTEFHKLNIDRSGLRDIYHWTLTLTWLQFAGFVLGIYIAINLVFSLLYLAGPGAIDRAESFSDMFFFSVETLATVGYGYYHPITFYGHAIATLEIIIGMFGMAVVTGVIFVRFSRPSARLIFSRNLVITNFDGRPALMLRVANLRNQAMAEAEFRLVIVRIERVKEGEDMRIFHPLTLQFDRLITFPVAITIRHIIDEKSPLHGLTAEDFDRSDLRVMASINGIDTVIPASVHSQRIYSAKDIHFGHRFVEIYNDIDAKTMTVDYARLHDIEPAPHL